MAAVAINSHLQVCIEMDEEEQNSETFEIRNASKKTLFETATLIVQEKVQHSSVIDTELQDKIPKFEVNELKLGRILGRGGFCMAIEIDRMKILENSSRSSGSL